MNKTLLFREVIREKPEPVFNEYFAIVRPSKDIFFFQAQSDKDITINILDEDELIKNYRAAKKSNLLHYVNRETLKKLNIRLDNSPDTVSG